MSLLQKTSALKRPKRLGERRRMKGQKPKRDWVDYCDLLLRIVAVATPYIILYLTIHPKP